MKNKMTANDEHQYQTILPLGCWNPAYGRKENILLRTLKLYQKAIDTALAAAVIGLMFLTGIRLFLVQLAEYGG